MCGCLYRRAGHGRINRYPSLTSARTAILVRWIANPATPAVRKLGSYHGTWESVLFVNSLRTFEWGVAITTFVSVLSVVPRHCARLTDFLHPKLRTSNAVLITPQPITHIPRHLRCACGAQEAFPGALVGGVHVRAQHTQWGGAGASPQACTRGRSATDGRRVGLHCHCSSPGPPPSAAPTPGRPSHPVAHHKRCPQYNRLPHRLPVPQLYAEGSVGVDGRRLQPHALRLLGTARVPDEGVGVWVAPECPPPPHAQGRHTVGA